MLFLGIATLFLWGCVATVDVSPCVNSQASGFLSGLWHGLICPFSFIVSLFDRSIGIYDINNTGALYNLGYILGLASTFGSGSKVAKKRK